MQNGLCRSWGTGYLKGGENNRFAFRQQVEQVMGHVPHLIQGDQGVVKAGEVLQQALVVELIHPAQPAKCLLRSTRFVGVNKLYY